MKIFDAHIRSETCSEADLKHLNYFGTAAVVTAAHDPRPFESASDLKSYFSFLVGPEASRLRRCGLEPHVALGVLPGARPRRAHYEIWRDLPELVAHPLVVAIGEVGVFEDRIDQWELFERQVRLALETRKPMVVTSPGELRINQTYKMMQMIERVGVEPSTVMINFTDERFIENVLRSGYCAGLPVGAMTLEPRQAARLLAKLLAIEGGKDRVLLNSALRAGGADVLAIPKTIEALEELGVDDEVIAGWVWDNASRLFTR